MILTITINQRGKRVKEIQTNLLEDHTNMTTLRKIWETEQLLNSLPGSDLRFHFSVEEGS